MATKKLDLNKPLPSDATIQEQVDYWTARVAEQSTGTRGRLARQSLDLATTALEEMSDLSTSYLILQTS